MLQDTRTFYDVSITVFAVGNYLGTNNSMKGLTTVVSTPDYKQS